MSWSFGIILSVISIGLAIIIYVLQRQRKELTYRLVSRATVVRKYFDRIHDFDGLEVKYKNKNVYHLDIIVMEFKNTGNTPIASIDYEEPLKIRMPFQNILSSKASEENKIKVETEPQENDTQDYTIIKPLLLNKNDSFTISILVDGRLDNLEVTARIIGIKDLKMYKDSFDKYRLKQNWPYLLVIACLLFYIFLAE